MIIRGKSIVLLLFSLFLITQAKKYSDPEKDYQEWQEFKEFQEFQEWKKSKSLREKELISDDSSGEENMKLIQEEENKSLERNYEKPRKGVFKKAKREENKSMERSDEKRRWKDKKRESYQKNKDKDYEKRVAYDKRKYFDVTNPEYSYGNEQNTNNPPPINETARMARYIVNQANWTSVATISSRKDIQSFPSANVISFSDGQIGNGSGIPYMFLTPLDFTAQDIFKDSRATLMMTLAQGHYCNNNNFDPMDPRCARVILTGKIKSVKNDSAEIEIAKNAVFGRHPWLQKMPPNHHFFFAKLKIFSIAMLDTFGGPKFIKVNDYLNPPKLNVTKEFSASDSLYPDVQLL